MLINVYLIGLEHKLQHFPTKKELREDMLDSEHKEGGIGLRYLRFDLTIGKHIAQENHSFHDIENKRYQEELRRNDRERER